ncbi:S-methyl-5-thioribose-1-phosphate isomerase [Candidatus Micrarchaeota archaeon]|nr:S-methyl-5-thioribose-1-phosphate isomerase [Candidatus Micrarchaeota archaeon]
MHSEIKKTIDDIKALKIQGARNIAKAAVNALLLQIKYSKAKNPKAFYREITSLSEILADTRPTEPMMRNALDDACRFLSGEAKGKKSIDATKKNFAARETGFLQKMDEDAKKLFEYGARLIPQNAVVMTHCHSSTVTGILKKAKGKNIKVIACETRPRYQGRVTAAELAKAGVDVTLIVDGAMNLYMKKADLILVGADSITSRGDLINKVGTSALAHVAKMHDVSFYSAAELFKYSSMTFYGTREKIEERDSKEVWEKPPKGVRISNPAFDVTAAKYINGYVTELGIIPPQAFFTLATQKLGIKIYE